MKLKLSQLCYKKIITVNECENEDLIEIVIDRLSGFQLDNRVLELLDQVLIILRETEKISDQGVLFSIRGKEQ